VAISVDTPEDSRELVADLGIRFALLSDSDLRVANAYGVAMAGKDIAVPAVFVVNPDRSIYFRYVGENQADRPSARKVLSKLNQAKLLWNRRSQVRP
jgi:peroxiredoxin